MKTLLIFLFTTSLAFSFDWDYLPDETNYTPGQSNYKSYTTDSLYKTSKYVLTYDDGPHQVNTPKILDLLKKYNKKATFFVVTSRIDNITQPIIKRILDEGHIIGSHHHDHDNNNKVSKVTFKRKLKLSFDILKDSFKKAGHSMKYFYYRFPYAAYGKTKSYHHLNVLRETSKELFNNNCIHFVFWDIDSGDWIKSMTSSQVYTNLLAHERGGEFYTYRTLNGKITKVRKDVKNPTMGGTILLHDIQNKTVEATRLILEDAKKGLIDITPLDSTDEYDWRADGCQAAN
jgi:peptidoglycan/xylan/chitin deacetylase (PgdA/CDA1 family)